MKIPNDVEAEAGALASMLESNGDAPQLLDQLCEEHFHDVRHLTIFRAALAVQNDSLPLNPITLFQRLKDQQCDENLIHYATTELVNASPSPENFPLFLATIKDRAARRAMLAEARELERRAENLREPVETTAAKSKLPAIIDGADFLLSIESEPLHLVSGLLHQGSKLVLGGGSKSFKTWTLLDLALSIAHGKPWLGHDTTPGKVLYINFEIQNYAWQNRITAVASAKGITIQPGRIKLWNLRGYAADFGRLLPEITAQTKACGFALIVVDPIYKMYGNLDENSAGDVAALLNGLELLAVNTGAAIAFGAHFSKGNQSGKQAIDRISGSGVFARDPDSILIFTRHEEEECFTVESILRNFAPVQPFAVRWQWPLFTQDDQLDPSRLKQSKAGRKREHDPRRILKAIADTTAENPVSISAWAHAAGIPRQTLTDYLPELRKQDYIGTSGEGHTARQYIKANGVKLIGVPT